MLRLSSLHLFFNSVFTDKVFLVLLLFKNKNKSDLYSSIGGLSIKSLNKIMHSEL